MLRRSAKYAVVLAALVFIGSPGAVPATQEAAARPDDRTLASAAAAEAAPAVLAAPAVTVEATGLGFSGHVRALLALPGDTVDLPLEVTGTLPPGSTFRWVPLTAEPDTVPFVPTALRAPAPAQPGAWTLELDLAGERRAFDAFHLLVKVPASEAKDGRLNGYHVGRYPDRDGRYAPPDGFVEVTRDLRDLPISRNLRLGSFLTHDQASVWPKYVVIDERLLDKLELLLDELRTLRPAASRITIMSGYRTPQYNARGLDAGRAVLSRHQYGDAADVWIDDDGDGRMDDLDGNGRVNLADARFLARLAERVEARHPDLAGGISPYPATAAHGPFVHLDARGVRARW